MSQSSRVHGDEVDQLLDPPEQRRVEVVVRRDLRQDLPPGPRDVGLVGVRPAEGVAHALLPLDVARHLGPALEPEPFGLDRRPDVDERVADDEHVLPERRALDLVGDPALLRARHEVVDQHPDPAVRARTEVTQVAGQVVDAAEVLHDHALEPQVVAPDLLDQLGVVPALDIDPALPCDAGPGTVDGDRAGRRTRRLGGGLRRGRWPRITGLPSSRKPGRAGRYAAWSAVLERDGVKVAVDGDDLAAEWSWTSSTTAPARPVPRRHGRASERASRWRARLVRIGPGSPDPR